MIGHIQHSIEKSMLMVWAVTAVVLRLWSRTSNACISLRPISF